MSQWASERGICSGEKRELCASFNSYVVYCKLEILAAPPFKRYIYFPMY